MTLINWNKKLKWNVYLLILAFLLLFSSSFLSSYFGDFEKFYSYFKLFLYFAIALVLIRNVSRSEVSGKLRTYLLLTGYSSIVFSIGILSGYLGMGPYVSTNEVLYFLLTIIPFAGFISGVVGSLILLRSSI